MLKNEKEDEPFNPEAARAFLIDLYRDVQGREPDPDGLAYHLGRMENGSTPNEVVRTFLNSEEYRDRQRSMAMRELAAEGKFRPDHDHAVDSSFPTDYLPAGEAGKSYQHRLRSGFLDRYCSGSLVLDVGFSGYDPLNSKPAVPNAIGVDIDYPGYDGRTLPFADNSVDTVISSHCLEHIQFDHHAIRDWHRVLKVGGFIVCFVPSQALYEKRRFLPSRFNEDHKRMYTPARVCQSFEEALEVNSYRVRHMAENDRGFNYDLGPEVHSDGAYEIELVVEKIRKPRWELA